MPSDHLLAARWALSTSHPKTAATAELNLTTAGSAVTVPPDPGYSSENSAAETAFSTDNRRLVSATDFKDKGRFRSIVKLQVQFENNSSLWANATGWLIRDDVLVTAGHVAFDHSRKLGRAVRVKAYIGYYGKDSVDAAGSDVQFRQGAEMVTTCGWIASADNRINDVAFVRLTQGFTGSLNVISYVAAPVRGRDTLGVVGYPADKADAKGEYAARMYEEFGDVRYDLAAAREHMLEYTISTYAGNSGSPVLRQPTRSGVAFDAIAAHTYGGYLVNSGGPIAGVYGNPYAAYLAAFGADLTTLETKSGIDYVSVINTQAAEFSFSDVLGVVSSFGGIASNVLNTAAPFLGPVAGPAAAIAGAALSCAAHLGESSLGPEASVPAMDDFTGFVQRGILAESALAAIFEMSSGTYERLHIRDKLEAAYKSVGPFGSGLGPHLLGVVLQPSLAVGVDAHRKQTVRYNRLKNKEPESASANPQVLAHPELPEATEADVARFVTKLWGDTVEEADEEWFFSRLGQVIYDGVLNGKTCATGGPKGFNLLSSIVASKGPGLPRERDTNNDLRELELRALCGEAAIQALIACDQDVLEQEGFFKSVKKHAQEIGRQAMQAADWVLPRVAPIVVQLLTGQVAPPPPPPTSPAVSGDSAGDAASGATPAGRSRDGSGRGTGKMPDVRLRYRDDDGEGVEMEIGPDDASFGSPGLDLRDQLLRRAALVAHNAPPAASGSHKETVRDVLFESLRKYNFDGPQFTAG